MSNVQLEADRTPHDLGRFVFTCGDMGRLKVIDATPVRPGDSYSADMVGAIRLAPLRRGLAIDSKVDICSFYIPHRHTYGEEWREFMRKGLYADPLSTMPVLPQNWGAGFLGTVAGATNEVPKWLFEGYCRIYDNYFCLPESLNPDTGEYLPRDINLWTNDSVAYGQPVCHLKNIWTAPIPSGALTTRKVGDADGVEIMNLQAVYGQLHTEQERHLFMQRYRDIMQSFGGSTHYDSDLRPHLLMRSEFWASGYDVDGTDQTSLGQFSGRVQQSFNHSVPRFYVPEHGAIITVMCSRFPPIHASATPYYIGNPAHTYVDFAMDPAIDGNQAPRNIKMSHLFRGGAETDSLGLAHAQWFRSVPDYVDERYAAVEGFPFTKVIPTNASNASYIHPPTYDDCFQSMQLRHWNAQIKTNVTVLRELPTARESLLTSA